MPPAMLSVIVPVRNGSDVLPGCLAALRQQTYPRERFEVLVVDDESTDHTRELVTATAVSWAQERDAPALHLIEQEWAGAGAARNRGASEAKGEILVFTDADCEPLSDWLMEMAKPFSDEAIAAVAGGYLTTQRCLVARLAQAEFEQRYRFVMKHDFVDIAFTHSAAISREKFLAAGGFDERMPNNADDLELSYRLASLGHRIIFAPRGLVYHRHPATIWNYLKKKFSRGYWRTLVFKRYPDKIARDSYTPQLLKLQIFLVGVSALIFCASLVGPGWLAQYGLYALLAMLLTTLPFACQLKGSLGMRILAPLFLLAQAAAIGAGTFFGLWDKIENYETGGKRGPHSN